MATTRTVKLLQDCFVETRHHNRPLNNGIVAAGEEVEIFAGNGYHTIITPLQKWEDDPNNVNPEATSRGADENRYLRSLTEGSVAVYGPCYEGEENFII